MLSSREIACMTSAVSASLDQQIILQRRTPSPDGYGHTTEIWTTVDTPRCNVFKPSATMLQAYAAIIGSQVSLMLRVLPTTDIREGDSVIVGKYALRTLGPPAVYGVSNNYQLGNRWLVQNVQNSESYTIGVEALISLIV